MVLGPLDDGHLADGRLAERTFDRPNV